MNFNAPLLRPIRILLFPLSLVYALVVRFRNFLFDSKVLSTTSFNIPVICIGNLSVGGTGKSTMVEYIAGRFHEQVPLAIVSRGYMRKTRGYALANARSTALEIGDEPMQFHLKFPNVAVAVGEERIVAIPQLLHDRPETKMILLDDAFQHRSVTAGLNILLTEYNNLFTRDWFLPTGDLRDEKRSYKRGDLIVVTKCPPGLKAGQAAAIEEEIGLLPHQKLFFGSIRYGNPYHLTRRHQLTVNNSVEVLLVSGIANPGPLKEWLQDNSRTYYEMLYSDHHIFTIDDWKDILKRYESIQSTSKIILTTEKDAVRLSKFSNELNEIPLFVMPIEMQLLFDGEEQFFGTISLFVNEFSSK